MLLTPEEKSAIVAAMRGLEVGVDALIPFPGNKILLACMRAAENELDADIDQDTLAELRAGVYDRLQARITARFARGSTPGPSQP